MASGSRVTTVGLDPLAAANAQRLLADMVEEGTESSRDQLVKALLWGVSAPLATGMVRAYIAHTSRAERDPLAGGAPDQSR